MVARANDSPAGRDKDGPSPGCPDPLVWWQNKGSEVIERRLADRRPEAVPADADSVERLIDTVRHRVAPATTNAASDPRGALALAYDAAPHASSSGARTSEPRAPGGGIGA